MTKKPRKSADLQGGDGDDAAPGGTAAPAETPKDAPEAPAPDDPTRFGDWQVKGRCIDF